MKSYLVKTNIKSGRTAQIFLNLLPLYFKIKQISFYAEGNQGVFRIKARELSPVSVQSAIKEFGYNCNVIAEENDQSVS